GRRRGRRRGVGSCTGIAAARAPSCSPKSLSRPVIAPRLTGAARVPTVTAHLAPETRMPTSTPSLAALSLLLLLGGALAGCSGGGGGGAGGGRTMPGVGPGPGPAVVVADGTGGARLSPFPDDRLTTGDPTSATGKRLALT